MKIIVNEMEFPFPWEKSVLFGGWEELRGWFSEAIENGHEYDEDGEIFAYPVVKVETSLPQQIVVGICYGRLMHCGKVTPDGTWSSGWYCAPTDDEFMKFVDVLRLAEHNADTKGSGSYSMGEHKFEGAP